MRIKKNFDILPKNNKVIAILNPIAKLRHPVYKISFYLKEQFKKIELYVYFNNPLLLCFLNYIQNNNKSLAVTFFIQIIKIRIDFFFKFERLKN